MFPKEEYAKHLDDCESSYHVTDCESLHPKKKQCSAKDSNPKKKASKRTSKANVKTKTSAEKVECFNAFTLMI